MKLVLVISAIGSGGAERVLTALANHWAETGWSVELLTFDDGSTPPFFALHPAVRHRALGLAGRTRGLLSKISGNLCRVRRLRTAIRAARPDAVIAFMDTTNVVTLLAARGLKIPVVVSERADPARHRTGPAWRALRVWLYPRAAKVVFQSERAKVHFPPAIRRRGVVIPNPVAAAPAAPQPRPRGARRKVVAMGRLDPQKGFDLLIAAFARVAERHPCWELEIWGEGPKRDALECLIRRYGLEARASLCGVTRQPAEVFAGADLFVLSSRYEGFPNVLCEAMACGLAAVSFDCPSGPREIIREGIDGALVPEGDVPALADALGRLMGGDEERLRFASRAREVSQRFGFGRVMRLWEEMLQGIVAR